MVIGALGERAKQSEETACAKTGPQTEQKFLCMKNWESSYVAGREQ